jgi:serine/threonine protein kinase
MAPEILLGDTYNEKVDVYSYAMCLLELVNCKIPWSGVATGAEVPLKVTQGQRPTQQLAGTAERPVDARMAELIKDCWHEESSRRPNFTAVILRLEEMMGIPTSRTASRGPHAAGSGPDRPRGGGGGGGGGGRSHHRGGRSGQLEPLLEDAEDSSAGVGMTRPASPEAFGGRE